MDEIWMDNTSVLAAKKLLSRKNLRFMNAFLNLCATEKLMSERKPILLNELKEASFEAMCNFQKREGGDIESITKDFISRCENKLLPMSDFDWLDKKNIRQCNFVWFFLCNERLRHYKNLINLKNDKKKYLEIIFWIDIMPGLAIDKISLIDKAKIRWEKATAYKNSNFDFLDSKNNVQSKKVINFLQTPIGNRAKQQYQKPRIITGYETSSDYYRFLLSVDWWNAPAESKEYFYKKLKDASRKWNENTKKTKEKPDRLLSKKLKKTDNPMDDSTFDFNEKSKQGSLVAHKENNKEKILDFTYENKKLINDEGRAVTVRRRKLKY